MINTDIKMLCEMVVVIGFVVILAMFLIPVPNIEPFNHIESDGD